MAKGGYDVYMKDCLLPVTPDKIQIKINNTNKTVKLINEGEINVLKNAGLTDIEFECEVPQVRQPYTVYKSGFKGGGIFPWRFRGIEDGQEAVPVHRVPEDSGRETIVEHEHQGVAGGLQDYGGCQERVRLQGEVQLEAMAGLRDEDREHQGRGIEAKGSGRTETGGQQFTCSARPADLHGCERGLPMEHREAVLWKRGKIHGHL